jgi:phage repressor protein C with HTH and peptisase S24 domain
MSNEIAKALDIIQYKTKKTLDEIAEDIGLSRPYLSTVKKKGEPLDILNRLIDYYQNELRSLDVSSESVNSFVVESLPKFDYQQERFSKKIADKPDIPVFTGNTRAGTIEIYTDDPSQQTPIGHLSAKVFPGCNHAEKVNGDSMYPLICNQAYVVGKIIDKRGIIWGEKYIIHTIHGQSVVKFIHPSKEKDCIKIVSHNKSIPEQDIPLNDISFCCRVHFIVNPS